MKNNILGSCLALLVFTPVMIMANSISTGPVNEKFIQWQNQSAKMESVQIEGTARATGWRPSPLPEEVYAGNLLLSEAAYPARFDLSDPNLDGSRNDSLMTPVGDQGECGVCWAFAGLNGSYEGQLSVGGLGTFDFSEQNLRYTNGTEWSNADPCAGGHIWMTMAYLARGSGPVSESDDPYDLSAGNTYNSDAQTVRYMDNILETPIRDINNKTDIDYIKNVVYNLNKPLYVSLQVGWGTSGETGESVWDAATSSFYCEGTVTEPICTNNHAVTIVGWDDNYVAQGQTGAFILKNSWGSSFGEEGYFYVPYNDDSIGLEGTIAYYDDKKNAYDNGKIDIYQHDSLPAWNGLGFGDETPIYGANVYTVTKSGSAVAVGLYANHSQTSYEIKLFKSVLIDGTVTFSEQIGVTQSGTAALAGWYTIELDTPADVIEGEKLAVQVKMSNAGGFPIPMESDYPGYTDAVSAPGESYYSIDGINFIDLYDFLSADQNFALKVLVAEPKSNRSIPAIIMYLLN